MARISVIIPAYNPGCYLREAVQSLLAQTFQDWEAVVIDDGSADDLSYVGELDHRICFIRQKHRGTAVARNVGIHETSGEFIAFLDADDVWLPAKLAAQLELIKTDENIGLCHTHFEVVDCNLQKISDGYGQDSTSYRALLRGCGIFASSVMVRRSCAMAVGLFDPLTPFTEDYDLWLRLARFYKIVRVPTKQACYRRHTNNISHHYGPLYDVSAELLRRHLTDAKRRGDREAARAARAGIRNTARTYSGQAFDLSRRALRNRDKAFWTHLWWAAQHSPNFTARQMAQFVRDRSR